MKRLFVIICLALMLSALSSCSGAQTIASWSGNNMVSNSEDYSWVVSASRVNGNITRQDVDFGIENLDMLHINSTNSEGEVHLTLIQGDNKIDVNITKEFTGFLITEGLEPGNIIMRLDFDNAVDVHVEIKWQGSAMFFN